MVINKEELCAEVLAKIERQALGKHLMKIAGVLDKFTRSVMLCDLNDLSAYIDSALNYGDLCTASHSAMAQAISQVKL